MRERTTVCVVETNGRAGTEAYVSGLTERIQRFVGAAVVAMKPSGQESLLRPSNIGWCGLLRALRAARGVPVK